jgi:hypothetical protein
MNLGLADNGDENLSFSWHIKKSFENFWRGVIGPLELIERDSLKEMEHYQLQCKVVRNDDGKYEIIWTATNDLEEAEELNSIINSKVGLTGTEDPHERLKLYNEWLFKNSKYCNRSGKTHEEIWGVTPYLPTNKGEN